MICSKCGTSNMEGSKFCIKCGAPMNVVNVQNQSSNVVNPVPQPNTAFQVNAEATVTPNPGYTSPQVVTQAVSQGATQNPVQVGATPKVAISATTISSYFFLLLAVILKPFTAFREELNKFDQFKNSALLSLLVAVFATIVSLIKKMLSVVVVKGYVWGKGTTTQWVWENLKEINYIQEIGKTFLIFLAVIVCIAGVYYIVSLILKKQVNFSRLLCIAAASIVPLFLCSMILSPILSMIYAPLGMAITIVGGIYTLLIMYETMNREIITEGNMKFYFNLICLSILAIAGYYLYMKVMVSSVSGSIEDIFNFLK